MAGEPRVLEVAELNEYVKLLLASDVLLGAVRVRGELSNYKIYPSGHHYFTMKDATSQIKCVMFQSAARKLRFTPENGMKVTVFGRVDVYERDGLYQFYANEMSPDGVGDLYAEYERLKEKLRLEGLFDPAHKKPLPRIPATVAVITSPVGAAVRDVIRILGARWAAAKVVVLPVRVQGAEAPREIVGAIRYANRHNVADLIITGRGGGSIEDLWAFNDERVARAIYESKIPVISAVGHEPDVTIADFVADVRAATPSNAAELAVPDVSDVRAAIESLTTRLLRAEKRALDTRRQRLDAIAQKRVMTSPLAYIDGKRITLDRASERLASATARMVSQRRERFARLAASLDALSPLAVLGRGYAIARGEDGRVLRSVKDVKRGDKIKLRLQKDIINCTVDE